MMTRMLGFLVWAWDASARKNINDRQERTTSTILFEFIGFSSIAGELSESVDGSGTADTTRDGGIVTQSRSVSNLKIKVLINAVVSRSRRNTRLEPT